MTVSAVIALTLSPVSCGAGVESARSAARRTLETKIVSFIDAKMEWVQVIAITICWSARLHFVPVTLISARLVLVNIYWLYLRFEERARANEDQGVVFAQSTSSAQRHVAAEAYYGAIRCYKTSPSIRR